MQGYMHSSLRNVFGGKPTPEASPHGSPHNPHHTAFSAHAQLQVQSNNLQHHVAPASNESITTPDAPNPKYSPRERLASTSLLEELIDSPLNATEKPQKENVQHEQGPAEQPAVLPAQHEPHATAAASGAPVAGNDIDSCTSAASVAFASVSLARNHPGVLMPQSQGRLEALSVPSGVPSRFSSAQHAHQSEVPDDQVPQQQQQLASPADQSELEGPLDKHSAELNSTTSIEISPPSDGNTGTPLLPTRAPAAPRGMSFAPC